MSTSGKLATVAIVLALTAIPVTACSQQAPSSKPATEKIQSNTESQTAAITAAIDQARAKVSQLASATGTSDAAIQKRLQQLERELVSASNKAGQAKIDAVRQVSASFTQVIAEVDAAAAKAPAGGPKQKALEQLSTKLKDIQTSLADAASGSSESTPGTK